MLHHFPLILHAISELDHLLAGCCDSSYVACLHRVVVRMHPPQLSGSKLVVFVEGVFRGGSFLVLPLQVLHLKKRAESGAMSRRDSSDGLRRGAALIIVASSWQPRVSRRSKQPVKKSMLDAACAGLVANCV